MALNHPFVSCVFQSQRETRNQTTGTYTLHTTSGQAEVAAIKKIRRKGLTTYTPSTEFVAKYGVELHLGQVVEWTRESDFNSWIEKIYFESFSKLSVINLRNCWYLKHISDPDPDSHTSIPTGYIRALHGHIVQFWILIQNGSKVWPIHIVNNQFHDGWPEFFRDHDLKPNYSVVLGSERKWLFNVIIIDEAQQEVRYPWSTRNHDLQNLHAPNGDLQTSCLPSVLFNTKNTYQFGYYCLPRKEMDKELTNKLLRIFGMSGIDHIVFKVRMREWTIRVENQEMNQASFKLFVDALGLSCFDFVFVSFNTNMVAQLVAFDSNGVERVYNWL